MTGSLAHSQEMASGSFENENHYLRHVQVGDGHFYGSNQGRSM